MSTARCAFCGHDNPAASHFCNECGAALHLTLCGQCEAVNDRGASHCHKCGAALVSALPTEESAAVIVAPEAPAEELPTALTALLAQPTEVPERSSRKRLWRPAAITVLLLVAIASAAIYSINRTVDSPSVSVASHVADVETKALPAPEPQGVDAASKGGDSAPDANTAVDAVPSALPGADDGVTQGKSEPTSEAADVAKSESAPGQPSASSPLSTTGAGHDASARPPEKRPRRDARREAGPPITPLVQSRPQASASLQTLRNCTDAVAALGLCNRSRDESK